MSLFHLVVLLLMATATVSQNNVCYSNCRTGYCNLTNALACSDCDPGLLNINTQCITTNIQPTPLTYLRPNRANTQLDGPNANVMGCDITQNIATTRMLFLPIIGNSHTRQFSISVPYSYLHIKFNAVILSSTPSTNNNPLSVRLNVVPLNDLTKNFLSTIPTINPATLSLNCNSTIPNRNNFYGVFSINQKFQANGQSIIVQTIPQGLTNSYIAVSSFQVFYGSCHQTCNTCVGATRTECTSCRGLLTTLTSNTCSNCPPGFYLNTSCLPCPLSCQSCSIIGTQVTCTSCITLNGIQYTLTAQGTCQSSQYSDQSLTGNPQSFSLKTWTSSEVIANPFSTCGLYQLLGGISIGVANSILTYTVSNLPFHSLLHLTFNLLLIDQNPQDNYQYQISVDGIARTSAFAIPTSGLSNQCGGSLNEYLRSERYQFVHAASSATIVINIQKSFLGVRDFLVVVNNPTTDPNCLTYTNNQCQLCRNGLSVLNGTCQTCIAGFYLMPGSLQCQMCPQSCSDCSQTPQGIVCTACRQPFTLDAQFCVDTGNSLYATELISSVPFASQNIQWNSYPNLQNKGIDTCSGSQMIGSSSIKFNFLSMTRRFSGLPTHTGVILYFTLYQIDDNYFPNNSLAFQLDTQRYTIDNITNIAQLTTLRMDLCGNNSLDTKFIVQLKYTAHNTDFLDFAVHLNRVGKIGISNVQLHLLGWTVAANPPFQLQIMPAYSVSTPANKGLQVKITLPQQYTSIVDTPNAFTFKIRSTTTQRLLVEGYSNHLVATNYTVNNQEIYYILNLTQDYTDSDQLQVRAAGPSSVFFGGNNGQFQLLSQQPVTTPITRYIDIAQTGINDRSSMRNLFNLFRGCAILALFIGIASFVFAMSAAFDDFFILCQLIFVHVFIQMDFLPPSIRIPFTGLHIVQFLEWLPSPARVQIQKGIIPSSLYQPTHLTFQHYYEDVVFARTIYHTILFLGLMFVIWLLVHIALLIYDSKHPSEQTKYQNFFVYYYKQYNSKTLVFVDKVMRFCYFTICWACFLQLLFFKNQPQGFFIWNSIVLTIFMLIIVVLYPAVMFAILYRSSGSLSDSTFESAYQQLRIDKDELYYYLIRYYKLLIIALVVAVTYNSSPAIPLIILIVINIVDAIILLARRPLGMVQPDIVSATLFYPNYPTVYFVTSFIQQILFVLMEIFFLILLGIRGSASSASYQGVGYVICVFVIFLLLNGVIRLIWGVLKLLQYCYLQREANYMSVQKEVIDNQQIDQNPIMATDVRTQAQLSRRQLTSKMMSNRKMSYVSKIR